MAFLGATDGVHFTISATDLASRTIRGVSRSLLGLAAAARVAETRFNNFFWRGTDDVKMWMRVIVVSLPVVPAMLAAIANAAGGMVSALVSIGPGVSAFAASVIGNFKAIKDSAAFGDMERAWKSFLVDTKPVALEAANQALGILSDLLPRLVPLANTFGQVFTNWLTRIRDGMNTPAFDKFLKWAEDVGRVNFNNILNSVSNLVTGIGNLAMAMTGSGKDVTKWLEDVTRKFKDWTAELNKPGGMDKFYEFFNKHWPPLRDMFREFARAITNITVALAPLGPHLVSGLTAIFAAIADADPDHIRAVALALAAFRLVNMAAAIAGVTGLTGALGKFKDQSKDMEDHGRRNERGFMATSRGAGVAKVGIAGLVATVIAKWDEWISKDRKLEDSWKKLKTNMSDLGRAIDQTLGPGVRQVLTTTFNAIASGAEKVANTLPKIRNVMNQVSIGTLAAIEVMLRGMAKLFETFAHAASKLAPFNPLMGKVAGAMLDAANKAQRLAGEVAALKSKAITVTTTFIRREITYRSTVAAARDPNRNDTLGFAAGGRPPVGRASLVGEKGPEMFVPDRPGTILPADVTAKLLAPGQGVDARNKGATIQDLVDAHHEAIRELKALRSLLKSMPREWAHQRRLIGGVG